MLLVTSGLLLGAAALLCALFLPLLLKMGIPKKAQDGTHVYPRPPSKTSPPDAPLCTNHQGAKIPRI
jgi:hypothetical protein